MRKKLNQNPFVARSLDNGIIFYGHEDCAAIATIDDDGTITTSWTTIQNEQTGKFSIKFAIFNFMLNLLILIILTFILIQLRCNPIYGIRISMIALILRKLSIFIAGVSMMGEQEKKFHSAEHMVFNAYKKLGRVPSLEEIRQCSRFHNSCGTNVTTYYIIDYILVFTCSLIPNALYILIVLISEQVLIYILGKHGFLNFLQKFTTAPPTDKELSVAIAGMTVLIENDKKEEEKSKFLKFLHKLFPRVFP